MSVKQKSMGDGWAMLGGGGVGILGGACLGACFAWLSGAFWNGMWIIVMVHACLAMFLMGAWVAPCFVETEADEPKLPPRSEKHNIPRKANRSAENDQGALAS